MRGDGIAEDVLPSSAKSVFLAALLNANLVSLGLPPNESASST